MAVQRDLEAIADDTAAEIIQIHREANERRAPLHDRRRAAIASVPSFWLQAFTGHPLLGALITPRDAEILEHCVDVRPCGPCSCPPPSTHPHPHLAAQLEVQETNNDAESGYSIALSFERNDFLTNETLSISLAWNDEGELVVTTTEISWRPEHDPVRLEAQEQAAAAAGGAAGGGALQKRSHDEEAATAALPVFLLTLMTVERDPSGALAAPADVEGEGEAGEAIEAICDAMKEEVWANPVGFYDARRARLAEEAAA